MGRSSLTGSCWPATLALFGAAALALAACGSPGATTSTSPSPTSSVSSYTDVMSGPSPSAPMSAVALPAPTVAGTIAFCKVVRPVEGGDADIYTVRPDGTRLARLTEDPGWEEGPSWSPDGKMIAFARYAKGSTDGRAASVWIMNADGTDERQLTSRGCGGPSWSPDGKSIAYTRYSSVNRGDLFIMNADGSSQRAVVRGHDDMGYPAWTPDGRIVFNRDDTTLYVVDPDGGGPKRLLGDVHTGGYAVSPDGTRLAYEDLLIQVKSELTDAIVVKPLQDGSEPVVVLEPVSAYVRNDPVAVAAWRPGGEVLAVATYSPGSIVGSPLYVLGADGSELSAVPGIDDAMDPAWRP
jgi:dipeptidyl aminopeptidase/acylaminoacyl peptidase